ncbi:hypothetical protein TIFTF001_037142 [Ficus carica]|uniref:Uncharacterized protein n=1 Tax=Ficus carica TaxID=3494 RepID=A0AA88E5R3_FICCA|nr:hypothetical protein TIFTF001_037142 [Ficus carica]
MKLHYCPGLLRLRGVNVSGVSHVNYPSLARQRYHRRKVVVTVSLLRKLYHRKPLLEVVENTIFANSVRSPLQSPSEDVNLHCAVGRYRSVMISCDGFDRDERSFFAMG